MSIYTTIAEQLKSDIMVLQFEGGNTSFKNVKYGYRSGLMGDDDALLLPDSNNETVEGQSAGNTQTTREYGFELQVYEEINTDISNTQIDTKYLRLMNRVDSVLDYIQKEPSNLNSLSLGSNGVVFKMRLRQVIHDRIKTELGIVEYASIRFSVFVNVVPQLL